MVRTVQSSDTMPGGGVPPKNRTSPVYRELTLTEPTNGAKSWRWRCNHCGVDYAWGGPKRCIMHWAKAGTMIAVCKQVPEERQKFWSDKLVAQSTAAGDQLAVLEAGKQIEAERLARRKKRTAMKLKRGIMRKETKGGKTRRAIARSTQLFSGSEHTKAK